MKFPAATICATLIVAAYVWFGLHQGVPALRHDWGIPSTPQGWKAFGINAASGWDSNGIGSPQPYPTLFVIGPILAAIALLCGSSCSLGALLLAIGAGLMFAGMRLAAKGGAGMWLGVALGTVLLFSPWSYEELVAGHLTMLLSVAACAFLAAELLSAKPKRWIVLLCSYVAAFQIQYALLVVLLAAVVRFERRTMLLVCLGSLLSLLPSLVGIVFAHSALLGIPYTLPWQYANSVDPHQVLWLDGYSFSYTAHSHRLFEAAGYLFFVVACAGFVCGTIYRPTRALSIRVAAVTALVLCYSTGLRGAFAPLYQATLQLRPTLVFRELFDVVGLVSIFYAVLAVIAGGRVKAVTVGMSISALAMLAGWFVGPPSNWWVPSSSVPRIDVATNPANVRFALLPARQPLQLRGAGSGADPDSYARPNGVTPVNTYSALYPSIVALAEYTRFGDPSDLQALSVAHIYDRPYFKTDAAQLHVAVPLPDAGGLTAQTTNLMPATELSVVPVPPDRTTPAPIHELYLFYGGDSSTLDRHIAAVTAPLAYTDPNRGWVNAALVLPHYPNLASPLGGAFTLFSGAAFPVPETRPARVLANLRGTLRNARGDVLSGATQSWKWIDLDGASKLFCFGTCVLTAWEKRPYQAAAVHTGPAAAPQPVTFRRVLPFVAVGRMPQSHTRGPRMLLFRVAFDRTWIALGLPGARHVRVSSIFNGFILPHDEGGKQFFLIELTAVLQSVAMLISLAGIAVFAGYRRSEAARSTATPATVIRSALE